MFTEFGLENADEKKEFPKVLDRVRRITTRIGKNAFFVEFMSPKGRLRLFKRSGNYSDDLKPWNQQLTFHCSKLPAVLSILILPVRTLLMSGHFLTHVYGKSGGILIVDSIPNLLIAIWAFSPNAIFIFFYDEF